MILMPVIKYTGRMTQNTFRTLYQMEEKRPEEDLDLINDRLITVLNHSLNADGL